MADRLGERKRRSYFEKPVEEVSHSFHAEFDVEFNIKLFYLPWI